MLLNRKIKQKYHNKEHNTPDLNESDELKEVIKGASEDVPLKNEADFDPLLKCRHKK